MTQKSPASSIAASGQDLPVRPPKDWRATPVREIQKDAGEGVLPHTSPRLIQPTHLRFRRQGTSDVEGTPDSEQLEVEWSSRAHRKGGFPRVTNTDGYDVQPLGITAFRWVGIDVGDISWWVAMLFLIGSVLWCINGVASFCYFTSTAESTANLEAWTAFAGGTLFFFGAILSYMEAINPHPDITFGHELDMEARRVLHPITGSRARRHHFGKHLRHSPEKGSAGFAKAGSISGETQPWSWLIPSRELLHPLAIGVLANIIQLYGATIFQISVILGVPGVLPSEATDDRPPNGVLPWNTKRDWMVGYWGCQIYASPGFIISGAIFMFEAQRRWYKPLLWGRGALGWHVGFWNMLGGFGFLFCGIFGIWRETSTPNQGIQKWGAAFSTFWGSWAFLIGSYAQYFETLNPHAA